MRALLRLLILVGTSLAAAAAAHAQTPLHYTETVTLAPDGSAHVHGVLTSAEGFATPVFIRAIGAPVHVTADDAAIDVGVDRRGGQPCVTVADRSAAARRAAIDYDVTALIDMTSPALAHGTRRLTYSFVNVTDAPIEDFAGTVVLPDDAVVVAVDDVQPAISDSTVDLPYRLGLEHGRHVVTLSRPRVRFGDATQLTLRMARPAGGRVILLMASLLGVLYLVAFRDLVRPRASRAGEAV